jgi:signal transduction histidine kinase
MNKQKSFKTGLIFSFIAVSVIPVIAIGLFSLEYLTDKTSESVKRKNELIADSVSWDIRQQLNEAMVILDELVGFLAGHDHETEEVNHTLKDVIGRRSAVESINILNRDGIVTHVGLSEKLSDKEQDYLGIDLSHRDFFKQVIVDGQPFWSDAFLSIITGNLSLTLAIPFEDGIIVANFSIENLYDRLKDAEKIPGIVNSLVDRQGIVIFDTDASRYGQKISLRNIEPIKAGMSGDEGTYNYSFNNRVYVGSVAHIPETGWMLLVSQVYEEAFAPTRQIRNIFIVGMIVTAVIAILIAIALSDRLIIPLKDLQNSTHAIAAGDYSIQLPPRQYKEIEELAVSFREMVTAVQDREQSLTESEMQLKKTLKTLEAKNEELQSIVYVASHDLRSPIVNIQGFSGELAIACKKLRETITADELSDEDKNNVLSLLDTNIPEAMDFIKSGSDKIANLLDGLLVVSRVGSVSLDIENICMQEMIEHILKTFEYQIRDKDISVTVSSLPECNGDRNQINQVFSNLVDNAIKYFDPDRKGSIEISGKTENSMSTYCVSDNGIGIRPEYQGKIFELFHRLDPYHDAEGEGLGLTIVRRIIDRHNGNIRVDSKPGKGCEFHVTLPNS